ncbi:hypothetical protein [Streptomyces sp. NPDC001507]|uniref:hypothetical protein n=1 Tax=Streptomyces sp. NPDC001507 TaxID=3364579 RepID=UPI0036AD4B93
MASRSRSSGEDVRTSEPRGRDAAHSHWAHQIHRLNTRSWSTYTPVAHHADAQQTAAR